MRVELIARFTSKRKKSEEDLAIEKTNSLLDANYEPKFVEVEFIYDPINIDIDNIDVYISSDRHHTQINMKNGESYTVRIPYRHFRQVYEQLTGRVASIIEYAESPLPRRRQYVPSDELELNKLIDDEDEDDLSK